MFLLRKGRIGSAAVDSAKHIVQGAWCAWPLAGRKEQLLITPLMLCCLARAQVGLAQHYAMAAARTGDWAAGLLNEGLVRAHAPPLAQGYCHPCAVHHGLCHHNSQDSRGSSEPCLSTHKSPLHACLQGVFCDDSMLHGTEMAPVHAETMFERLRVFRTPCAQMKDTEEGRAWLEAAQGAHMRAMDAASAAGSLATKLALEARSAAKKRDRDGKRRPQQVALTVCPAYCNITVSLLRLQKQLRVGNGKP